ncbi:hypothetical protein KP509_07G024600 [Ceratopteris richardii]|uniref:RRM domain-containing protein n=1 Tax=Ceratopteris richardii TaxID=49495 RepID=A0A8T2UF33_CERRI|nr:hypothetical protein KP509_07G024600 [Ceratopteris richardii]
MLKTPAFFAYWTCVSTWTAAVAVFHIAEFFCASGTLGQARKKKSFLTFHASLLSEYLAVQPASQTIPSVFGTHFFFALSFLRKNEGSRRSEEAERIAPSGQRVLEKGNQKTNEDALPSQHLWIGNVSASVTKNMLAEQFSRFGDIESITLFSQKNYAFVTLKIVEDVVYAKKGLQGTILVGLGLRIEFAKGDGKTSSHGEVGERIVVENEKSAEAMFQNKIQKDIAQDKANRVIHPDDLNRHCSEMLNGNRNAEACEVMWIGLPLHLKIDEKKLHKLFAPFGGVEKITTFPGQTYAFIRFQNVKAGSRAKDALQGNFLMIHELASVLQRVKLVQLTIWT